MNSTLLSKETFAERLTHGPPLRVRPLLQKSEIESFLLHDVVDYPTQSYFFLIKVFLVSLSY